jgi:uncharacterized protein
MATEDRQTIAGTPDARTVRSLVEQIVAATHPMRIVLFGSAARGDMGPNSDLDVMVVVPDGSHPRQVARLLYHRITGLGSPFDLVVTTPSVLEAHKGNIGLIFHRILAEGREIHGG